MNIHFKRCIIVFLLFATLFGLIPISTFAEESDTEPDEEYIYTSELFYTYPTYLVNINSFISAHKVKFEELTNDVLNEYITTPNFYTASVMYGIREASGLLSNPQKQLEYISKAIGTNDFEYNRELDKANVDFLKNVCSVDISVSDKFTKSKTLSNLSKACSVMAKVDKHILKNEKMSEMAKDQETFDSFWGLWENNYYDSFEKHTDSLNLASIKGKHYSFFNTVGTGIKDFTYVYDYFKALTLSLAVTNTQMELIQAILDTQPSNSTIYKGLSRLKNQLRNGAISYLSSTFLEEQAWGEICDYFGKHIEDTLLKTTWTYFNLSEATHLSFEQLGLYEAVISTFISIIDDVVFKNFLDINYSQYIHANIMNSYALGIYQSLEAQSEVFQSQFDSKEIEKYRILVDAFYSCCSAALSSHLALAKHNTQFGESYISGHVVSYGEFDFGQYCELTKQFIKNLRPENRIRTSIETWEIRKDTTIYNASDEILENAIYTSSTGELNGDINIYAKLTISDPSIINGNVSDCNKVGNIKNNSTLIINGDVFGILSFENNGVLEINGDVHFNFGSSNVTHYGQFIQTNEDAEIHLRGNYYSYPWIVNPATTVQGRFPKFKSEITAGTLFLDGTETQSLTGLKASHIVVTNPNGIEYKSDMDVTEEFELNGNPLVSNGYITYVNLFDVLDHVSDYHDVYIRHGGIIPGGTYSGEFVLFGSTGNDRHYIIQEDTEVIILGSLRADSWLSDVTNNGRISVSGNVKDLEINNAGVFEVKGDITYYDASISMSNPNAIFSIGGNIRFDRHTSDFITDGIIMLNGTAKQRVDAVWGWRFPTLILDNHSEDGIVFAKGGTVTNLFIKNDCKCVFLKDGYDYVTITCPDYDGDGLKDDVDPEPMVGNPCVISVIASNTEGGSVSYSFVDFPIPLSLDSDSSVQQSVDTVGGTKIALHAVPYENYSFICWKNKAGTTVSSNPDYTFVAKKDDTLTAYFEKNHYPIMTDSFGGDILVAQDAEYESEVTVSVLEWDGFMYVEGSLTWNDNPLEGNSFVMPNEPVYLYAEFRENEFFWSLLDAIYDASRFDPESYSEESFIVLQNAIQEAINSLDNHISESESNSKIELINAAITNLEYIDTPRLTSDLKFSGASLTLYDNLTVNFKVKQNTLLGFENPYVVFQCNGFSTIVNAYRVESERYVFDFNDLAPNRMGDIITATLYAEKDKVLYCSEPVEYSAKTYCYNMLNNPSVTDELFKRLVVDLLSYGAAAQTYTNYKIESLVNEDLTEEQLGYKTEEIPICNSVRDLAYEVVEDPDCLWKGAGLLLDNSIELRFKIATDTLDQLSIRITNGNREWYINDFFPTDNGYYFYFNGLNAAQMHDTLYLTAYRDGNAVSNTITYSIESYIASKQNDESDMNLQTLVNALICYGCSAENYINR